MYRSGRIAAFPREKSELLASEHRRLPPSRTPTGGPARSPGAQGVFRGRLGIVSRSTIVVSPVSMRYLDQPIELVTVFE
jgi:hypothetical protein